MRAPLPSFPLPGLPTHSSPRPPTRRPLCLHSCREVMYESGADGKVTRVTGLKVGSAGRDRVVTADAYVAALDVPGIKKFLPAPWRQYKEVRLGGAAGGGAAGRGGWGRVERLWGRAAGLGVEGCSDVERLARVWQGYVHWANGRLLSPWSSLL